METVLPILIKALPTIISLLQRFYSPTPPPPAPTDVLPGTVEYPHEFVKQVQAMLAAVLKKPIEIDGWVGPETKQAMADVMALLKTYGITPMEVPAA